MRFTQLEKLEINLLNPDSVINFGLEMRSELFEMWSLQDVNEKRNLQNLISPSGFTFNKDISHVEPENII